MTAKAAYLRASNYLRTAEFFLQLGDDRKMAAYLKSLAAFQKSIPHWENPPEIVNVPFDGSYMPGYLFKTQKNLQEGSPLVIMFGGLDSCAEEMWYGPGCLLNERGISVLVLDGPGQGGALRLHHLAAKVGKAAAHHSNLMDSGLGKGRGGSG